MEKSGFLFSSTLFLLEWSKLVLDYVGINTCNQPTWLTPTYDAGI